MKKHDPGVKTIGEKCKLCYTCLRECPAKAIGITDGQAEIIASRCISCGNCVKVCSQNAKQVSSHLEIVHELIGAGKKVAAIIAPSFPAEFFEIPTGKLVGALKHVGFSQVVEVGFGADMIARAYGRLLEDTPHGSWIATTCPAVVAYVEKYHTNLIPHLVPIVSPMIATARALKKLHGEDLEIVFIGPCIAKKVEILRFEDEAKIAAALTFNELRSLFETAQVPWDDVPEIEFDPPQANTGGLLAISGGLLQAAGLPEDLLKGEIVNADGKVNFLEALKEFHNHNLKPQLLETLSCEGCIMGPGFASETPLYAKRAAVSNYMRQKIKHADEKQWRQEINNLKDIDLSCSFAPDDQTVPIPDENKIKHTMHRMGKKTETDELNCGACGYDTCRSHAIAILSGIAESEMCLPYSIERLKETVNDLEKSYKELKNVKETLNHREKLASMGQLSAGIAHEVNNPLGVVLMYAHLLLEQCENNENLKRDVKMIVDQADRCKKIVSGLLNFSRQNKTIYENVNLYELTQHCLDSIGAPPRINLKITLSSGDIQADVDRDQISQVIINLVNNAIDAMGDEQGNIIIDIGGNSEQVILAVSDDGRGIPEKVKPHIFDPFFTTKQMGKGTGLGLPVCYGIIKMHRGNIFVESNAEQQNGPTGTTVKVILPRYEDNKEGRGRPDEASK